MSLISRTVHSLRTRGVRATCRSMGRHIALARARFADRTFDRRFASDTAGVVENTALKDVASPHLAHGIRYEPTFAAPLVQLLRATAVPAHGTFVDIGCGKGRVLMLAALYGFRKLTGVDYSASLCQTAGRNLNHLRQARALPIDVRIVAADAAEYVFQPDDRVVYLFNPFDDVVLRMVLAHLGQSLAAHPRPVWLIYHHPVWRAAIDERPEFMPGATYSLGGRDFVVYRTR
ncbi:MAG TPA: class I SAM-dependent methyltransferase [Candidatus Krumholzibacteria bacterium]|nr:class I SAM-dependent methyltransferase [Candidatus Krumholzibacteria bacterium]